MNIPEKIQDFIKNSGYTVNETGMSDSDVYMFEDYVLKVQPATAETDNEYQILQWLDGKIPVPEILAYVKEDGQAYTLMTRAAGKMLCDEEFMRCPAKMVSLIASGLRMLWGADIRNCDCSLSRLDERLKAARENVETGKVDADRAEPETFGPDGFADPEELLLWLENHRPEEDLVLSHGDFCLPNIFSDGEKITAFIDNGKMGPADRWQDLAVVLRSLQHNFDGVYSEISYEGYEPGMLLKELNMEMDEEKNRYYRLLDELF